MRILKAFIGGLVGGGCGIAVVVLINVFAGYDSGWLGLIIGVLTGLCVGYVTHGTERVHYLCGTIAALVTLAAIVLGKYATASVFNVRTAHLPTPAVSAGDQPGAEEAVTVAERQMEAPDEFVANAPSQPKAPKVGQRTPNRYDTTEVVWLSLAAVVAYFLGRTEIRRPVHRAADTTSQVEETNSGGHEST